MPVLRWVGFVVLTVFLGGCATIVSGTTQKISVSTQPSGADATADGAITVKTPGHLTLERKSDHVIEFSKAGYKASTVFIRKTLNEMAGGNILLGGVIGVGIDAASGSGNKLIPERIDLILEPGEGHSEKTKFATQKDQDYYDNTVLKAQLEADKKKAEREADKARKAAEKDLTTKSNGSTASAPTTNFGPRTSN